MYRLTIAERLTFKRKSIQNWLPLILIVSFAIASFIYGWYLDSSKPQSGVGWADQNYYRRVTDILIQGKALGAGDLHYSVGYSILGIIGSFLVVTDPFLIVSLLLFLGSVILCFLAVRKLLGIGWAVIYCLLLLAWDGIGKTFNTTTELFIVPWNNQVVFFGMSFFFWILTAKSQAQPSYKAVIASGAVAGLCILAREETLLFIVPLTGAFLYMSKASIKKWIVCGLVIGACLVPQVYYKTQATGSILTSTHDDSYKTTLTQKYFQPRQFINNTLVTIFNSSFYHEPTDRIALFQASPWLWLSIPGAALILFTRRYSKNIKVYVVVSIVLMTFYLSGANMSGQKLRFHCLRYISPALIALNLSTVAFTKEIVLIDAKNLKVLNKGSDEKSKKK